MKNNLLVTALISVGSVLGFSAPVFSQTVAEIQFTGSIDESCTVSNIVNGSLGQDGSSLSSTGAGGASGSFDVTADCSLITVTTVGTETFPGAPGGGDFSAQVEGSVQVPGVGSVSSNDGAGVDIAARTGNTLTVDASLSSGDVAEFPSGTYSATVTATLTAN